MFNIPVHACTRCIMRSIDIHTVWQGAQCRKYLIYTRTKDEAIAYMAHVARSIGMYSGLTDGKKRVDVLSKNVSLEDKAAILADFTRADSTIRVLFASIVIGMGTHIFGLYNLWRIGAPRTLVAWVQQFGRVPCCPSGPFVLPMTAVWNRVS